MYYYIYDSDLNNKKYNNLVSRIETRLTDLGINGKINYLSFLKNIKQLLTEEIKRGVKTIIIVGNDQTIGKMINIIADFNVVVGIIPVGPKNKIAKFLGVPEGEDACDTLSSRLIEKIDLGLVNNYYFLTSIESGGGDITIECDNSYIINLEGDNQINISNLNHYDETACSPTDDTLDVFLKNIEKKMFKKNKSSFSHIKAKLIRITSNKLIPILLSDERKIIKTPANIKIVPKKIKLIVGKKRI